MSEFANALRKYVATTVPAQLQAAGNLVQGVAQPFVNLFGLNGQPPAFLQNPTPESKRDMGNALMTLYAGNAFNPAATADNALGAGIKAYHGSPYDFDKFDASKIGTGEGAQAYGHGLYFAENENVAKGYRDNGWNLLKINGETVVPKTQAENDAASALAVSMGDPERALRELVGKYSPAGQVIQDWVERGLVSEERGPGKMYEVNINASPDQFLDWDKPLSEQSPEVRSLLNPYLEALKRDWSVNPELGEPTTTGQVVSGNYGHNKERMAVDMQNAGIPGIRYLDQGSRGQGEGTYNYVVFPGNEHLIEIVKKYGLAGAATMLGMKQSDLASVFGGDEPKQNALAY